MGKIKGIPVVLLQKEEIGKDPFNAPVYRTKRVTVDNVLVAPMGTDDVINQLNLTGKKAVYTLGLPKGDQHIWEDQEVEFFGQKWRTFGHVIEGIETMIPLDWNKKVMVERYE